MQFFRSAHTVLLSSYLLLLIALFIADTHGLEKAEARLAAS